MFLRRLCAVAFGIAVAAAAGPVLAAGHTPVMLTGFNADGVAETASYDASTSLTTANTEYRLAFYTRAYSTTDGYLPDNGRLSYLDRAYRIWPFNGNNVLALLDNQSGTLQLTSPQAFDELSFLVVSTTDDAELSVQVEFTDGSLGAVQDYTVENWYEYCSGSCGTIADAIGGYERTWPSGVAGHGANLFIRIKDIDIAPADRSKAVRAIRFNSGSVGGYEKNAVMILAVSGPGAVEIPTLSEWAMILFAGLLAGGAGWYIQRQRRDPDLGGAAI